MSDIIVNPLFQGVSRPKSWFGADYNHIIFSAMITTMFFLVVKNPLALLIIFPSHLIGVALYSYDPYFYNILKTLGSTRIIPKATAKDWGGTISFSPLATRWKNKGMNNEKT